MERRRFTGRQRIALYLAQGGHCALCNAALEPGWHADHRAPWSRGGITDTVNGQALCAPCNLKKGAKEFMDDLTAKSEWPQGAREWQLEAWEKYLVDKKQDWLLCATPGAGKTRWALHLARYLLNHGTIERVVIVAPTQSVRNQWAEQDKKKKAIIDLDVVHNEHGGIENSKDFEGCVVTYAQVASQPDLQRLGCMKSTLVIFDEIHHAGFPNRLWGEQTKHAFEHAIYRVALTGTPWRRPGSGQIPFVKYSEEGKVCVDYAYEYGQAVNDEVCRSIEFRAFNGEVEYVLLADSCVPNAVVYTLEDEDDNTTVLRDLLKPDGKWMRSMLDKAHLELTNIRRGEDGEGAIPDAKGLVVADSQQDARMISKYLEKITREKPELIISDEADSEEALDRFREGTGKWAVAVNKVSEGVDVPALYVGVYATRKKTPLIFRQIVGRFVRRRVSADGKPRFEEDRPAVLFMPAVPTLKELAQQIEEELRHTLDVEIESEERERSERTKQEEDTEGEAIPLDISTAELDVVIVAGRSYSRAEYSRAEEYTERMGFRPDQITKVANLLREVMSTPLVVPIPHPQEEEGEYVVSQLRSKQALFKKVELLSRRKAQTLKVEVKDLNKALVKRFGQRRALSIDELKAEINFLNTLDTSEGLS